MTQSRGMRIEEVIRKLSLAVDFVYKYGSGEVSDVSQASKAWLVTNIKVLEKIFLYL